jgi:hypothetical protein
MTNRITILNELQDLGSNLAKISPKNIYHVPEGYFEGLAQQILNRIKALEVSSANEELEILSPVLNSISKENPFTVPAGYFDNLNERLMQGIREHADYQTSDEEIASLSPLLSNISKKSPYSVPDNYFENLSTKIVKKEESKVISITSRKLYRFAIAAVFVGVVAIGAFLFINPKQIDPNKNPQAWLKKNVNKKISQEQLDNFVALTKANEINKTPGENVKTDEIKALMKDVSEKEIQEFLNDAVALESNDAEDIFLN